MAKASMTELEALQRLVVKSLSERISQDMEDNLPTDAATLGAAIKLLKDNNVTADPADKDDLSELRDNLQAKLDAQRKEREARRAKALELVRSDMDRMVG